jgi:hypothetical protein
VLKIFYICGQRVVEAGIYGMHRAAIPPSTNTARYAKTTSGVGSNLERSSTQNFGETMENNGVAS